MWPINQANPQSNPPLCPLPPQGLTSLRGLHASHLSWLLDVYSRCPVCLCPWTVTGAVNGPGNYGPFSAGSLWTIGISHQVMEALLDQARHCLAVIVTLKSYSGSCSFYSPFNCKKTEDFPKSQKELTDKAAARIVSYRHPLSFSPFSLGRGVQGSLCSAAICLSLLVCK